MERKEQVKDQMLAKSKGSESRCVSVLSGEIKSCRAALCDAHFFSSSVKHPNFAGHV